MPPSVYKAILRCCSSFVLRAAATQYRDGVTDMKGANIQNQMDIRTQKTLLLAALTTPQLMCSTPNPLINDLY